MPFGPDDTLPAAFNAVVEQDSLRVTLDLRFGGERVSASSVHIERIDDASVTPRDVAGMKLGEVIYRATKAMMSPGHGAHIARRPGKRPDKDELRLVAACYSFEHAAWGNPRRAVMAIWADEDGNELPRATANRWINKARELYPMPKGDDDER